MALQPFQAQRQTIKTQEADDSGSKIGSLLGAVLAGGAVAATGGAALPAVLGAAGTGMSLGGLAGGVLNKKAEYTDAPVAQGVAKQGGEEGATAIARRAQQKSTNELMALTQAENALAKVPEHLRAEYEEPIKQARMLAQQKYGAV